MSDISETIQLGLQSCTMILNSKYDLTAEAMEIRGQRPLYSGDSYEMSFALTDSNGSPINIAGATITFTAKYSYQDADAAKILQKTATIISGTGGTFKINIAKGDVSSSNLIRGYYDIQIQSGIAGVDVKTVVSGMIEFLQDVTKTTA